MNFCLSNRLPEIKIKLIEIAWLIVSNYFTEINLDIEDFYLNLAEEIKNIEKYDH